MVTKEPLDKTEIIVLNDKESKLIKLLRDILFGKVTIYMEDGKPVRVEEIRESIKL